MSRIDCTHCYDSGLCYVSETEEDVMFFMVCDCKNGDMNQKYFIPRWNREAARLFVRQKFLYQNWIPKIGGVLGLIQAWNEKIHQAECYWQERAKNGTEET